MRTGVVSLNVCCGLSSAPPPAKERAVAFCSALEASGVGIVNLQEVTATSMLFTDRVRLADGRSTFASDHLLRAEVTLPAPSA